MTLFLVGQVNELHKYRWQVIGIFDSEEQAKSHCTSWYDFYGPIKMNEYHGKARHQWPGCRYPVAEDYYIKHPEDVPEEAKERYAELIASFVDGKPG